MTPQQAIAQLDTLPLSTPIADGTGGTWVKIQSLISDPNVAVTDGYAPQVLGPVSYQHVFVAGAPAGSPYEIYDANGAFLGRWNVVGGGGFREFVTRAALLFAAAYGGGALLSGLGAGGDMAALAPLGASDGELLAASTAADSVAPAAADAVAGTAAPSLGSFGNVLGTASKAVGVVSALSGAASGSQPGATVPLVRAPGASIPLVSVAPRTGAANDRTPLLLAAAAAAALFFH